MAPLALQACPFAGHLVWHNLTPRESIDPRALARAHVVITTYSTCASEYATYAGEGTSKKSSKKKAANSDDELDSDDSDEPRTTKKKPARAKAKKDALFRVHWHRIVLGTFSLQTASFVSHILTVDHGRRGAQHQEPDYEECSSVLCARRHL